MPLGLEGRAGPGRCLIFRRAAQAAGLTAYNRAPSFGCHTPLMDTFLIDVPMPSMGATVNELTVVTLKIQAGARVSKGQKLGELESDKSIFDFEAPCDGTIRAIHVRPGDVKASGGPFLQIETADAGLQHLKSRGGHPEPATSATQSAPAAAAVWTPRATKLAQEAGRDPAQMTDIEATGPGGRVSGDDVARYIEQHPK
jgi:pyruvate/2-oxoglutarate dehydrogenase complex dihydrolipoamide acyltransferase (E2) component